MAKKRHFLTLSSLMAVAILAVVSIGPATGQTNQLPTAEVAAANVTNTADPTSGAVGDFFFFDGTASVDPDGTVTRFEWDFGDATNPVGGPSVEGWDGIYRTFGADGTYTVTLTVTDNGGATNDPADPKSTVVITIGTGTATTTTTSTTTTTNASTSGPDEAALFTTTCSVCHTQADLAAKGLSNAQIVDVMTSGLMTAQASSLSSAEIQAVADYIVPATGGATTTTSPSATTTTTAAPAGASASSLFTATCSACHTKANIADRGLSSSQIASVLTSGIMQAQASSLSSSQIQAVASYLAASGSSTGETTTTTAAPAGASGASLFTATCSACHTKANIADRGLSSEEIVAAMTSGIMTSQAGSLSSDQIQAVASYITSSGTSDETAAADAGATATFTASPEAAGLYDANCAACHGTSGEGGVGPSLKDSAYNFDATVATVSNGVGSMPGFSSGLTEDQIKDIAAYSVGFQGATATELPSGEGADVYAASCAACHGAKGEGASAMPINVPFDNDQLMEIIRVGIGDMPGFATTLSDTQITSLAEYVHALAAMSAPPVTEAPPSEDYIVAIQPSKYVEFDTERSSVPLEPTARLAFALGTLAVLAGLAYWEIQRARKGTGIAGSGGTSPSGSA